MRLGMTSKTNHRFIIIKNIILDPPYILDYLEEIAEILNHPRVYSFLHIPVQSASDAVLADMKREYTSQQFSQVVDYMIEK